MSFIGTVSVPASNLDLVFPLPLEFPLVTTQVPQVAVHQFNSGDRKITQRYLIGANTRRFLVNFGALPKSRFQQVTEFFESVGGAYSTFLMNDPETDENIRVRFADETLTLQLISDCVASGASLTFIEVPATTPSYSISTTTERFPATGLNSALSGQSQEVFPLVKIIPQDSACPAIYVSDRKVTVGANTYEPRLLDWSGIGQSADGASDQASFVLGNADRVFSTLTKTVNIVKSRIEFSLFHVGTTTKLDLWAGDITNWGFDASSAFRIEASDGLWELRQSYPSRKISRNCWKTPAGEQDGLVTNCPFIGTCDRTWETCGAHDSFGGILANPEVVYLGGFARAMSDNSFTSKSIVDDNLFGKALPEVYMDELAGKKIVDGVETDINVELPVDAMVCNARDENEFMAAIGIVADGEIAEFGTGHTLNSAVHFGAKDGTTAGLRLGYGYDPVPTSSGDGFEQFFNLSESGTTYPKDKRAAGTSFVELRTSDEEGKQLRKITEHTLKVLIKKGIKGWAWSAPGSRAKMALTNPVWIAINMLLKVKGLQNASAEVQEQYFDVDKAIADAAFCNEAITRIVGTGSRKRYQFRGIIREEKALRDWFSEVLNHCLGGYTFSFGKLRTFLRANSGAVSAFTEGNIVADSLAVEPINPNFNQLSIQFGNGELEFVNDAVSIAAHEHARLVGSATSPKYTKADINLAGIASRDEASVWAATRLKEELGGATVDEWIAARKLNFKTTILALETEPGMVCSLTHPDLPANEDGGTHEFRILRWKLNKDFSIDIEGRSTTDAIYDALQGPNPVDVVPSPLPEIDTITLIPGIVTDITTLTTSEDGSRLTVPVKFKPPTPVGSFTAVKAFVRMPDDAANAKDAGKFTVITADLDVDGFYTVQVEVQKTDAEQTAKIYLVSCSNVYERALDLTNTPHTDPITVPAATPVTFPAPNPPTAVGVALDETDSNFSIAMSWTPPDPLGGTVGYEREVRYFSDAACTIPVSDWIAMGSAFGGATASITAGPWPKATYDSWLKGRVRAFNAVNEVTDWVESTSFPKLDAATSTGITVPDQVTSSGWSVAVVEYGADEQTGKRLAHVRITVTEKPASTDYFTFWFYKGSSAPSDPALFKDFANVAVAASGDTILDTWDFEREDAAVTYQFAVTSSNFTYTKFPDAGTPVKSVTFSAWSLPAQVAGFNVTCEIGNNGGVASGRFNVAFTKPIADDYWFTKIDRRWSYSDFTPQPGEEYANLYNVVDPIVGDWFPLPATAEYWQFRARTVSRPEIINDSSVPTFNVTVPSSTGVDLSKAADASVGKGITKRGTALQVDTDDFSNLAINPGFESGFANWAYDPAHASISTTEFYTGSKSVQMTAPTQIVSAYTIDVRPGDQFILSVWAKAAPGATGGLNCLIQFRQADGTDAGYGGADWGGINSAATTWTKLQTGIATVPANARTMYFYAAYTGGATGTWYLDNVLLRRVSGPDALSGFGTGVVNDGTSINSTYGNPSNLLSNPDFEFDLKDWASQATSVVTSRVFSGTKAVKVETTGGGAWTAKPFTVKAGEKYVLTSWLSADSSVTGVVASLIRFSNDATNGHAGPTSDFWAPGISPTTTWTSITTGIVTVPSGYKYMWVFPVWTQTVPSGPVYCDSGELRRVYESTVIASVNSGTLTNLSPEFGLVGGQLAMSQVDLTKAIGKSAEFTITGGLFQMASVDFSKATNFSTSEFEKVSGLLQMKALAAEKIKTGILEVGGGSRPSRMRVYDTSSNLIGWVGDDTSASGFVGAWFKRLLIGGTSPALAQIVADSNGNVAVNGSLITGTIGANVAMLGTVTLNANNITTTITNVFDATLGDYVGVRIQSNTTSATARMSAGKLYLQGTTSTQIKLDATTGSGLFTDSGGTSAVEININGLGGVTAKYHDCWSNGSGYKVAGVTAIDIFRNGDFNNLRIQSQLKIAAVTGSTQTVPSTYSTYIWAYDASGTFLGKIPVF